MVINLKKLYIRIMKLLLCLIIFLTLGIICKKNITYKDRIKYELYERHLSFTKIKELYNHYLGGYLPLETTKSKTTEAVFNEKLSYTNIMPYEKGARLTVGPNYLVANQESGVVVYVGEKENYGNVIIIEGKNDIDTWYGNICNSKIKLYDYLEKGSYIGETCNEYLYIVYSKNNQFLDYKNYLS